VQVEFSRLDEISDEDLEEIADDEETDAGGDEDVAEEDVEER
jgi:hypothetical protein